MQLGSNFFGYSPKSVILLAVLLLGTSTAGLAQLTQGTIEGRVTDESKAVVPGVEIAISNVDTGVVRNLITDEGGRYRAPNISPKARLS